MLKFWNDELDVDGTPQCKTRRADIAALHRSSEVARAERAVVALLEQRQHALPKFSELRGGPFAPEQAAAKLALELCDGARQGRLRDVSFFGGAGEV